MNTENTLGIFTIPTDMISLSFPNFMDTSVLVHADQNKGSIENFYNFKLLGS